MQKEWGRDGNCSSNSRLWVVAAFKETEVTTKRGGCLGGEQIHGVGGSGGSDDSCGVLCCVVTGAVAFTQARKPTGSYAAVPAGLCVCELNIT
jgi:hypothetical protein